jgi:regulatory protein
MGHKVTALKAQKRNPQRVNVYLEGEYAFSLARIVAAWLQVGQELDEAKIHKLQEDDANEKAYQRALKFISLRLRSENEVLRHLRDHQIPEEIITGVIERLKRSGLVDDLRFAQTWVENRNDFRPRSQRALMNELRQKGISSEVIDQVIKESDDDVSAYQVAEKQSRKLKNLERPEFRRKLAGYLARRGFSYETITPVVDRVWAEQRSNNPSGDEPFNVEEEQT